MIAGGKVAYVQPSVITFQACLEYFVAGTGTSCLKNIMIDD